MDFMNFAAALVAHKWTENREEVLGFLKHNGLIGDDLSDEEEALLGLCFCIGYHTAIADVI